MPFPRSVAALMLGATVVVAVAGAGRLFVRVSSSGSVSIVWIDMICRFAGLILLIISLVLHWGGLQARRRRMKYELMIGFMGMAFFSSLAEMLAGWNILNDNRSVFRDTPVRVQWPIMCWLFLAPLLVLGLGVLSHLIVKGNSATEGGHQRAVRLHSWITPLGKLAVLFLVIFPFAQIVAAVVPLGELIGGGVFLFLYLYLFVRFELKRFLLTHPILYLRSFHSDAAALAFARVVVPVAGRYGVLAGLAHSVQPAHVLQHEVPTLDRGSFVEVSDERWREWVKHALASCHLVIIDVSNLTDSVKWEMETAMNMVGARRILLLEHKADLGESVAWQADWLYYSHDRKWTKPARRALARWFANAVNAPLSVTAPATAMSIAGPSPAPVAR